jgi:hypothetical protein
MEGRMPGGRAARLRRALRRVALAGAPLVAPWAAPLVASWAASLGAQAPGAAQSVDDLAVSGAPAFVLLGVEPATVQRPVTPRGLKASLLALPGGGGDGVPRTFALEVTPYWLPSRPRFTVDQWFAPGLGPRLARTTSVAIATAPTAAGSGGGGDSGTSVAASVRTALWTPGMPAGFARTRDLVVRALGACVLRDAPADSVCVDSVRTSPAAAALRTAIAHPRGLTVELAGGLSGDAPDDVAERLRWRRTGVWLTPSYRVDGRLEAVAVARWLRVRPDAGPAVGTLDAGARLLWRPTPRVGFSGEVVGRRYGDRVDDGAPGGRRRTARYGALVEYAASEQWFVFYAFGKDFAAAGAPRSRLLTSLGLNVGAGRSPRVAVP